MVDRHDSKTPSDRLQVRDAGQQGRRIERPCQPLKMEDVAASVAMTMLILVIVVARCGGNHYRARIWTVVAGVISGKQPTFGLIYQYFLGLWRCAWAALCWKQVSARRLTFRSLMCRAWWRAPRRIKSSRACALISSLNILSIVEE